MRVCYSGISQMTITEFTKLPISRRKRYAEMADKVIEQKNETLGAFASMLKGILGLR